jgi:phosphonate transport system substrate-binding protein
VLPAFSAEKLVATLEPLVDYLSEAVGTPLRMETARDFAEFLHRTHEEKRYAFLFTAPHLYLIAQEQVGYRALARVNGPPLRTVVVALRDGPIMEIAQLKGRAVASPDPLALISVQGLAMLRRAGMEPGRDLQIVTTPTMDASLQALLRERVDAALLIEPFLEDRTHPEVRNRLRVVGASDGVPNMPFSAAPWVDPALAEKIVAALLALPDTQAGSVILKKLSWQGFVVATPDDYRAALPLLSEIPH